MIVTVEVTLQVWHWRATILVELEVSVLNGVGGFILVMCRFVLGLTKRWLLS